MAKDIFRTPLAEVRWAHLITPRHQLDKSKPKAWTADLLLPNSDEKAQSFLLAMEDQFIALHGSRKRRAEKGFPWKPDKEKPSEITVVRFKVPQFQRRDGSLSEGPRIVDAKKQPWDGAAIGNGSKVIVAFDIYDWDGENGCGMTFQPRAVQVVEFVPYEQVDPTDGFEEVDGYTTGRGCRCRKHERVGPSMTTTRPPSDGLAVRDQQPGRWAPAPSCRPSAAHAGPPPSRSRPAAWRAAWLVLLGLLFQLSTLLLVIAGPVPPRPGISTNTAFRSAVADAGGSLSHTAVRPMNTTTTASLPCQSSRLDGSPRSGLPFLERHADLSAHNRWLRQCHSNVQGQRQAMVEVPGKRPLPELSRCPG